MKDNKEVPAPSAKASDQVPAKEVSTRRKQLEESSKKSQRTIGHYEVGKEKSVTIIGKSLGQGTFGKVRMGIHQLTHEKVAIKILEKDKIQDQSDVERVTREIHILKIVRHPNVVQLYEVSVKNKLS